MASHCIARGRSPPNGLTYPKTSETYPNDHLLPGVVRQSQSSVSAVSLGRQSQSSVSSVSLSRQSRPSGSAAPGFYCARKKMLAWQNPIRRFAIRYLRLRRSSLQCTHLKIRPLQKVIPLLLRGIILCKSLTINCVRCSRGLNCVRCSCGLNCVRCSRVLNGVR